MVRRHLLLMILLVTAASATVSARASSAEPTNTHLARARHQKTALQYEAARASLGLALRQGNNNPAQLAQIYRLNGEIEASLGDRAAAVRQFRVWLAIDPSARLPVGTSPKLTGPLDAAKASFGGATPLEVQHRIHTAPAAAVITVVSDTLSLVDGVRVAYRAEGQPWATSRARGPGVLRVLLPASRRLGVVIEVVDEHGNALATYGTRDQPMTASTRADSSTGRSRRPFIARWPLWTGLAVALAGGTTWLALDARSAQRSLDDIYSNSGTTEYSAVAGRISVLEQRGRRSARLANIGMGLTGAAALTAAVLAYTGRRASVNRTRGGATVSVALRF